MWRFLDTGAISPLCFFACPKNHHCHTTILRNCFNVVFPMSLCNFVLEVLSIANTGHQINSDIRDSEVRVISDNGDQLGILSLEKALGMAEDQDLDLVKISPNANPPVCKIMDYGKFRYEQSKREKEAKKNQRVVEIKEIRMSPGIDTHDFNVKLRNAQKFLTEGNRCKVTVRFRGREMAHTNIGKDLLMRFAEECSELAVMDKTPKLEGRHMSIFLASKILKETKNEAKQHSDQKSEGKTESKPEAKEPEKS